MKHILILGAGEIGTALGNLLTANGHIVQYWDRDPSKSSDGATSPSVLTPQAEYLFICVPSIATRQTLIDCGPLNPATTVVCLSKGIEPETHATMDKLLGDILPPSQPWALLSGPMLAEEIRDGRFGAGVVASTNHTVFTDLQELFANTHLHLEYSSAVHAIALASVLKNAYALALGIIEGLDWGANARGWFAAQCLNEMAEAQTQLNGDPTVTIGTAGAGDFLATGSSHHSKNHEVGIALARGEHDHASEGTRAATALVTLVTDTTRLPILAALHRIVTDHADAHAEMQALTHHDF